MIMMFKLFRTIFVLTLMFIPAISFAESTTFTAGISMNKQVPSALMGTWRVTSVLQDTDSPVNFQKAGVDIWNLSKTGDVITLSNPFTGASASISVSYVNQNTVRFSKEGNYDKQKLTDTVEITLNGNSFQGKNYLKLETIENGVITKAKTASYVLRGEKISGTSILDKQE